MRWRWRDGTESERDVSVRGEWVGNTFLNLGFHSVGLGLDLRYFCWANFLFYLVVAQFAIFFNLGMKGYFFFFSPMFSNKIG